ncbi:LysR family transcriptional regulator [Massilia sp. KIM]|uniref:LysR substrate-binding domain-containing protein n=1 Tax=Massilia sp. KIM TaxID=1955422 RepID=UPI00098F785B|nr:LysR family transcriptional regulator [Massilia sp. KIM]OON59174.1 LysR family transcriptional regulator [Massilia sp. KIM]
MNELDTIAVFLKVAELGSFSGAARQLGLPNATVSAAVRELEQQLGTRLLQRTTRRVQMTQEGEAYFARSREVLEQVEALRAMFREGGAGVTGRLRVDMPVSLATDIVLPRLGEFMARHPQLLVDLGSMDRRVDLVRDGYDCVIRIGELTDSNLVARHLGSFRVVNCASPDYIARHGVPRSLEDLAQHRLVHYDTQLGGSAPCWEWFDGEATQRLPAPGALTVNNTAAYRAACVAGLGIAQAPAVGVAALVEARRLVEVLPEYRPASMPLSFVYPSRRHVPARTRLFMDWVAELLAPLVD